MLTCAAPDPRPAGTHHRKASKKTRTPALILSTTLILCLTASSGYKELPRPWTTEPAEGDFESARILRPGDEIRLTAADGQISEGIFVELDDLVLTLAETSAEVRLVSVPVEMIRKLEAYRTGSGETLRTVAAVAAASAIIYAIVDSESGARAYPDDSPTPTKASR